MKRGVIKPIDILYAIIFLMVVCSVLQNTLLRYSLPSFGDFIDSLYNFLRIMLGIFGVWKFLSQKLAHRNIFLAVVFCFIFIPVFLNTRYVAFFDMFFIPVFLYNYLDYKRIIDLYLKTMVMMVILIFIMYLFDWFPDYIFTIYRNSELVYRYSFGFGHPNGLGRHILIIATLFFLKYDNRITLTHILILILMVIWVYIYPQSMTATFLILFLATYCIYSKIFKKSINIKSKYSKLVKKPMYLLVPLLLIASYAIFAKGVMIDNLTSISRTLGARFFMASSAINKYGFHLFGSKVQFVGKAQVIFDSRYSSADYSQVDNFLIYFTLTSGVLASIFFIWYYTKAFKDAIKRKRMHLSIVLIIMLIYSFSENSIMLFSSAFIFMLPMCDYELIINDVCAERRWFKCKFPFLKFYKNGN